VSAVVMALAGAILAPKNSYVTAQTVFNPEVSFLTVIAALLGGATSVWGPMLGVVPLLLVKDYLSIAYSSHFSMLLGLILLGVVFFIPNGILGLLQKGRAALDRARTGGSVLKGGSSVPLSARAADVLEVLARRLRAVDLNASAPLPPPSRPSGNGAHLAPAREALPEPHTGASERKALQ